MERRIVTKMHKDPIGRCFSLFSQFSLLAFCFLGSPCDDSDDSTRLHTTILITLAAPDWFRPLPPSDQMCDTPCEDSRDL